MKAGPVLRARNLNLQRGSRPIYFDLSLDFGTGITAVLGPNGVGKTTLLEALSDPTSVKDGLIELEGRTVGSDLQPAEYFARTGFMPQKWAFYRGFSVQESITYSAWLKGLSSSQARSATVAVLKDLDLESVAKERVHRLSGGVQQRVGIAESFVHAPSVVFLDEPTVGLDPEQRHVVREYLKMQATSKTVVVSTHLTDDVEAIADRVVVISDGRVVFDAPPHALAARATTSGSAVPSVEAGYLKVIQARNQVGS